MVTLQILVLPFLVRVRVAQHKKSFLSPQEGFFVGTLTLEQLSDKTCGTMGGTGLAEAGGDVFIASELGITGLPAGEDAGEVSATGGHGHLLGDEFGDDLTPRHEVHK